MKKLTAAIVLAWASIVVAAKAMEPVVPVMWRRGAVEETARDLRDGLAFAVAEEWRGAAVSRLGPDGREESPETVSARWTPKCAFAQMQPEFFVFAKCDKIHTCEF